MVSLLPVRGGVLDAPRSCDRRGGVGADGRRDRWHPRYPRHTRLRSPLHVSYPAGTARAPLARRAGSTSSVIRRKGRRGRRPLRVVRAGRCQHKTAVARPPGCVRRNRWAWPIAPAFPTVRTVTSASTRIRSRGHSPRTILYGRTHVIHRPTPGGRGSPPLRWVAWVDGQRYYAAPTLHQPLSHGAKRRDSSPFRGAEGTGGGGCPFASAAYDADASISHIQVGTAYLTRRRVGGIIPSHDRERGRHFAASKAWPRFAGAGRGASAL